MYIIIGSTIFFLLSCSAQWYGYTLFWVSICLCLSGIFLFLKKISIWKRLFFIAFFICVNIGGIARTQFIQHNINRSALNAFTDSQHVELTGIIAHEPDIRRYYNQYTIEVTHINERPIKSRSDYDHVLVRTKQIENFVYGDTIKAVGIMEIPSESDNFSYKNYLLRYSTSRIISDAHITKIQDHTKSVFGVILEQKQTFESLVNKLYPEPQSSFMAGLLIGSRKGIPEDLLEQFNTTGLTHVIAISGYNITLIIVFLSAILGFIPRKTRYVLIVIGIIIFCIFTGATAAVVRASIMGILGLMAYHNGRSAEVLVSISATAASMVLYNPLILWYDAGFQLSFLAVLGLVLFGNKLESFFSFLPQTFAIRESVAMTIAAQIIALPLMIVLFEKISLVSVLANVLVAPFLTISMFIGFISVALGFISYPFGLITSFIATNILSLVIMIIQWCSQIPFASIEIQSLSALTIIFYYICVSSHFMYSKKAV